MWRLSLLLLVYAVALPLWAAPAVPAATPESPYLFTDGKARITLTKPQPEVAFTVKTITVDGYGPTAEGKATVAGGVLEVAPLTEGLHIVTLQLDKPCEVRFLAVTPPTPLDTKAKRALLAALPRTGKKLLGGKPFTLISMGDSVTATGDYDRLLTLLLQRATGNAKIAFVKKGYGGRSVDASVRFFKDDVPPNHPDLACIMYGLNDQAAGCPLDGYLEQYRWLADRMAECGADTLFLTPTPDASFGKDFTTYSPYLFRTIGFADALLRDARAHRIPAVDVFHAYWGKGGATLDASGRALWPKHPQGYSKQLTSVIETNTGDGIHPNALGHLTIARAVFDMLTGRAAAAPLAFSGESVWTADGLVSHVTVRNVSAVRREGRLELYPLPDDRMQGEPAAYALAPGETLAFDVAWPRLKAPADLLAHPAHATAGIGTPAFTALDFAGGGSTVYAVTAPMRVDAQYVRERQVVTGNTVTVTLRQGGKATKETVAIPANSAVGRVPLIRKVSAGGQTGWAAAELAYVQFGAARTGEATVDGALDEWAGHTWLPVGEPVQARFASGVQDGRATPQECYLRWAFKAGKTGFSIAVQATGTVEKDSFTLFFDSRAAKLLGTPGRYYWVSGTLKPNGTLALGRGETTAKGLEKEMRGAWRAVDGGAALEIFIPYAAVELTAWPAGGDLGVSIWWKHTNADPAANGGRPTNLMWSEDGHPWNTRWYGVVRLNDGGAPLPYLVRVK
jgi:lysophospholipase L1-like esterase